MLNTKDRQDLPEFMTANLLSMHAFVFQELHRLEPE